MDRDIVLALIGAGQAIILALIAAAGIFLGKVNGKVNKVREDSAVTRDQVANDHSTNLREEQDERHHENTATLDSIGKKLDTVQEQIGDLFSSDLNLYKRAQSNSDRIWDLERTIPPQSKGQHHERTEARGEQAPHPHP